MRSGRRRRQARCQTGSRRISAGSERPGRNFVLIHRQPSSAAVFSSLIPGCATPSAPESYDQVGDANCCAATAARRSKERHTPRTTQGSRSSSGDGRNRGTPNQGGGGGDSKQQRQSLTSTSRLRLPAREDSSPMSPPSLPALLKIASSWGTGTPTMTIGTLIRMMTAANTWSTRLKVPTFASSTRTSLLVFRRADTTTNALPLLTLV